MKCVDIVIPTKRREHAFTCLSALRHVPWCYKLHLISDEPTSWSKAVNLGLSRTKHDVILMDDDVFVGPDTFSHVDKFYQRGDVFGFKLKFPNGLIQHAGGFSKNGNITHMGFCEADEGKYNEPRYTCHLTTSLVYIKRQVLDQLHGMAEDYPGLQFEDVDFSFRALAAGFRLLYLPQEAIHMQSASKSAMPRFNERIEENLMELKRRWLDRPEWQKEIEQYPKPLLEIAPA